LALRRLRHSDETNEVLVFDEAPNAPLELLNLSSRRPPQIQILETIEALLSLDNIGAFSKNCSGAHPVALKEFYAEATSTHSHCSMPCSF
jgi:hypothetical protein